MPSGRNISRTLATASAVEAPSRISASCGVISDCWHAQDTSEPRIWTARRAPLQPGWARPSLMFSANSETPLSARAPSAMMLPGASEKISLDRKLRGGDLGAQRDRRRATARGRCRRSGRSRVARGVAAGDPVRDGFDRRPRDHQREGRGLLVHPAFDHHHVGRLADDSHLAGFVVEVHILDREAQAAEVLPDDRELVDDRLDEPPRQRPVDVAEAALAWAGGRPCRRAGTRSR